MNKENVNKCKTGGGKSYLTLYKNNGKFYIALDEDAYILNLLFRYKILEYNNSYKCGFPDNVINKVLNTLEDKHISYRIYCADGKIIEKLFKLNNKYEKYKKEALSIAAEKAKIDMIINKLKIASEDDLKKIMEYIESCLE